jgi:hypothetical protein
MSDQVSAQASSACSEGDCGAPSKLTVSDFQSLSLAMLQLVIAEADLA